jgi:Transglutaminase-like superfamily
MEHLTATLEALTFWATPGRMTVLDEEERLPNDLVGAVQLINGLLVHEFGAAHLGLHVPPERRGEIQLRSARSMVDRIRRLDPRPLDVARPPERRLVVNCRHFAVMACAVLRRGGVPVRARCGHATYFGPGEYGDHWIVEVWDAAGWRWVRVDPDLMVRERELDFDTFDIPAGRFLPGGEAWRLIRSGGADPDRFGTQQWWGAWFVRCNVVRDLAALNRVELLPWDAWGLMDRESAVGEGPADDLVDQVAAITAAADWPALRHLYESDARLTAPDALR